MEDSNLFVLEPGPAAFYLPAEESKTGQEVELFKYDISSFAQNGCLLDPSIQKALNSNQLGLPNDEPIDVPLSLDDFKNEGIDLNQIIKVDYDSNGVPIYSSLAEDGEDDYEYSSNQDRSKQYTSNNKRLSFNHQRQPAALIKSEDSDTRFKKRYSCPKCNGKTLVGIEKVVRHMLESHCGLNSSKTRTYNCSLCDSALSTESSLKKHIRNVHFRMEAFECPVCKKQILQRSHLRRHIEKIHGGRKALKKVLKQARDMIKQNKSFFNEKASFQGSMGEKGKSLLINPVSPKFGGIGEGGASLISQGNTNKIEIANEDEIGRLFNETQQCPTCGILCTSKIHLGLHVKDRHQMGINHLKNLLRQVKNEERPSIQDDKGYSKEVLTYRTLPNVAANSSLLSVCPICAKDCGTVANLSDHVSKVHKYLTQYKCRHCFSSPNRTVKDPLFFSQAVLDAHIEDAHDSTIPHKKEEFKCEHCKSAKFAIFHSASSSEFLDHILASHAYGCAQCPKHFSTTGGLKYHYKKAHFRDFSASDDTKHATQERLGNDKPSSYAPSPSINSDNDTETERNKSSEFSVDTGDEAFISPLHSNLPSAATINSEDKAINPQILAQIRVDVNKIVERIQSAGGNSKAIPCDFCRSTETHEDGASLLHHICTEHPYRCIYCPEKMVKLPTSMRKHFRKYHRDETPYFCRFCTAVFICQGDANQHALTSHSGDKNTLYRTTNVGSPSLKVTSPELIRKGLSTDDSIQSTPGAKETGSGICIVCDKDFGDLRNLSDHVQETHNYVCEVCNREYKLADSIRKHCRKDHSDYYEEPIVCCRFCPSIFHNIPAKQQHITTVHGIRMSGGKYLAPQISSSNHDTSTSNYPQTPSDEQVKSPTPVLNVSAKENTENSNIGPVYKCPHCTKGYDITDSLRKHAKNAHDVALGFCRDCQLVFLSHEQKAEHMQNKHNLTDNITNALSHPLPDKSPLQSDTSPRQASILTYMSPSASEQPNQSITSSGNNASSMIIGMAKSGYGEVSVDDAYQCPKCPKIYAIAKSLRKHCRKVHDELSICFCSTCTKVFVSHDVRDSHVSNGECKGFQSRSGVSSNASDVMGGANNLDIEASSHSGLRKRRCSAINETNHITSSPGEPTSRLRRTSASISSVSANVLNTSKPTPTKSVNFCTDEKRSLVLNSSNLSTSIPYSPAKIISSAHLKPVLRVSPGIPNRRPPVIASSVAGQPSRQTDDDSISGMDTHDSKHFQCDFCEVPPFESMPLLESHWLDCHPFGCTLCSKRYKLASSLRRHLHEAHHKKEVFVCHMCTLPFFSFGDKQKHLPSCQPILPRKVEPGHIGEMHQPGSKEAKITQHIMTKKEAGEEKSMDVRNYLISKPGSSSVERGGARSSPRQRNLTNETDISRTQAVDSIILRTKVEPSGIVIREKKGNENVQYTSTLPVSPLNFHGFKRPSSELEIVAGLGDFRVGLNAYAAEYFVGNTVFDTELFEAALVTDNEVKNEPEETFDGSNHEIPCIVPEITETMKIEDA